ncbi:hypothetical protein AB4Y45_22985 [Paraburkholderia sp. EG287A]|uniref:hypothetical protein n=1 Tax=Paraburkholderia sp. EG287A TaxID=3237012 RepID=UPI0034D1A356
MDMRTDGVSHRKTYIMLRIQQAMHRLSQAKNQEEYASARRWVNAWCGALGELRFSSIDHAEMTRLGSMAYQHHA